MSTGRQYGFGVVDQNDNPYWEQDCVSADLEQMRHLAAVLNEDATDGELYRAVRLLIEDIEPDDSGI